MEAATAALAAATAALAAATARATTLQRTWRTCERLVSVCVVEEREATATVTRAHQRLEHQEGACDAARDSVQRAQESVDEWGSDNGPAMRGKRSADEGLREKEAEYQVRDDDLQTAINFADELTVAKGLAKKDEMTAYMAYLAAEEDRVDAEVAECDARSRLGMVPILEGGAFLPTPQSGAAGSGAGGSGAAWAHAAGTAPSAHCTPPPQFLT
jgi:hypothetical protein